MPPNLFSRFRGVSKVPFLSIFHSKKSYGISPSKSLHTKRVGSKLIEKIRKTCNLSYFFQNRVFCAKITENPLFGQICNFPAKTRQKPGKTGLFGPLFSPFLALFRPFRGVCYFRLLPKSGVFSAWPKPRKAENGMLQKNVFFRVFSCFSCENFRKFFGPFFL